MTTTLVINCCIQQYENDRRAAKQIAYAILSTLQSGPKFRGADNLSTAANQFRPCCHVNHACIMPGWPVWHMPSASRLRVQNICKSSDESDSMDSTVYVTS